MDSNYDIIKTFKQVLNENLFTINTYTMIRKSGIITFDDIIYWYSYMIGNNVSYNTLLSHIEIDHNIEISKNAIMKKKNSIDITYFEQLNNSLLEHIYDNSNRRIVAVDGTKINLSKELHKDGLKKGRNGGYCYLLISAIIDIEREIPLNYNLSIDCNERTALISQMNYLNKNDILIMDRGYYSGDLFEIFTINGIKTIFRLKSNSYMVTKLNQTKKNSIIIINSDTYLKIKIRILKYTIEAETYYIGTTLYKESIDSIKKLYWKRWKIETHFNYSKNKLFMKDLDIKNMNNLNKYMSIYHFIFIVSFYFQSLVQKMIDNTHKVNATTMLHITINNLLPMLIYKNTTKNLIEKIINILTIASKNPILISNNRHYERIRIKPTSKWCHLGNKYIN